MLLRSLKYPCRWWLISSATLGAIAVVSFWRCFSITHSLPTRISRRIGRLVPAFEARIRVAAILESSLGTSSTHAQTKSLVILATRGSSWYIRERIFMRLSKNRARSEHCPNNLCRRCGAEKPEDAGLTPAVPRSGQALLPHCLSRVRAVGVNVVIVLNTTTTPPPPPPPPSPPSPPSPAAAAAAATATVIALLLLFTTCYCCLPVVLLS